MKLNPITALSEQLQKLINEHGSAAILRDHLSLFKDQVLLLEKENVKLKSENIILASKIEILESKNEKFSKENDELRQKIQIYEQTKETLSHNISFKMQWGCLLFAGDKRLYCPSCFHSTGKKIETSRVDTHNRYCAVCKTKIPSG